MSGFRILLCAIIILLQTLVYFQFIKYLKTTKFYKPSLRWYAAIPFLLFNVPFIIITLTISFRFTYPDWVMTFGLKPFYVWEAATFLIGIILLIGKIIKLPFKLPMWIMKLFRPAREWMQRFKQKPEVRMIDASRRKFVRTAMMGVSAYAFAGATYGMLNHDKYKIEYRQIKIANLPPELKGLTLTLISDIHAGQYMSEGEMREYADVINDLKSDLIFIPGDFINFQVEDTKSVALAFRDLKAKYGVYGSLGNHDFFVNANYVAAYINKESPIRVMRNEVTKITVNGKDLAIIGVDDTRDSGGKTNPTVMNYIDKTINEGRHTIENFDSTPKILLCHKPYAFDEIATRNIDLMLSGHTHGGQVVPIKFGDFNMSFAALVSKYIEGHYQIGNSNMYVSRGIGSVGLPIRLNCPPEITKITLV